MSSVTAINEVPRALSLRKNFGWTMWGNSIYAACQWGMLVALARLAKPDAVGVYAFALAIVSPVMMLTSLQLRAVQATDTNADFQFAHYMGLKTVMTVAALVIIAVAALIATSDPVVLFVTAGLALSKALDAIVDVYYGLLQNRERLDTIATSMMSRGVLCLIVLAALIEISGSLVAAVFGCIVVSAGVLLLYDIPRTELVYRQFHDAGTLSMRPTWNSHQLARLAWTSLPLGIVMMLVSFQTTLPRYFIEHYAGIADVGVFSAIAYLTTAATVVIDALGQSAMPRLAKLHSKRQYRKFLLLLLTLTGIAGGLGVGGCFVAIAAGSNVLGLVYGPVYSTHSDIFVILMAASAVMFVTSAVGYSLTAARVFRSQVLLSSVGVVAVLIGCAAWVPANGIRGAAYATLAAAFARLLVTLLVIIRELPMREALRTS